jgi:hypothetical protein
MWLGIIFNAWVGCNVRQSENFERVLIFAADNAAGFVRCIGACKCDQLRKLGVSYKHSVRWLVDSLVRWFV